MNKLALVAVRGTGLGLTLAARTVHADAVVQSLTPATMTAAQFNADFVPDTGVMSNYTNVELVLPVREKHTRCEYRLMSSHLVERTGPSVLQGIHWPG